ncbi:hypothetical protein Rhe02_12780 [Rhizocola hellebori]|uniref:Uncharacterized protein n=1 Tax=Rhizocola hellebori TaxID=1392758 RepID=A0A8J3Q3X4_9ACTN|nr:hypothetical protein [Rhizocola hellebori]GIH03211.1 hypothetical protein Rhe02_12780 [Rhizocola hellebori]
MDASEIQNALARLRDQRAELDLAERALIEQAREAGLGWAQIASALGLASRQAAEQRLLRLSAGSTRDPVQARAKRAKQRIVDNPFGPSIAELRSAARAAQIQVAIVDGWDALHPRAGLIRRSLELAVSAPPSGLYELARQAIEDSTQLPVAEVPPAAGEAIRKLALTLEAATPKI